MRIIRLNEQSKNELKVALAGRSTSHMEDLEKKVADIIHAILCLQEVINNDKDELRFLLGIESQKRAEPPPDSRKRTVSFFVKFSTSII